MQQSRRELVDEVLAIVGEADDATARTLAETLINTAILRIWMKHPFRTFRMADYTFATTANTRAYPLPHYFGRIPPPPATLRNITTGSPIAFLPQDDITAVFPAQGTTLEVGGVPSRAFIGGSVGVGVQPASSGQALEVISDAIADSTTVKVTVEGIDGNDRENRTQVSLNGTTAVAVGTWKKILTFSKAYADGTTPTTERTSSAGNVSLRIVSSGSVLQLLLPMESAVDRPEITLHPVPNGVYSVSVPVLRMPRRLMYDGDMVPSLWGPAIRDYMIRNWRVSTGEIAEEGLAPYPSLLDLIALDNVSGGATPGRGIAGARARY